MNAFRSFLFNLLSVLWTLVFGLVSLPILVFAPSRVVGVADHWTGGMLLLARWCCGITHRVVGEENRPAAVIYAAKHQSAWETLALWRILDHPVFVLKRELLSIPVFGTYLRLVPHIAIDRSSGSVAIKQLVAQGRAHIAAGRRIVIFPEGTRTRPGEGVEYKSGIVTLYRQLGVPVVPVALNSGAYWGRRAFTKRPGEITVVFLPPLQPGMERTAFKHLLEEKVEQTSRALLEGDA